MISHMESNLSFQEYQNHIKFMRENHGREIIARIIDEELWNRKIHGPSGNTSIRRDDIRDRDNRSLQSPTLKNDDTHSPTDS